jgi:hypothetical protein
VILYLLDAFCRILKIQGYQSACCPLSACMLQRMLPSNGFWSVAMADAYCDLHYNQATSLCLSD